MYKYLNVSVTSGKRMNKQSSKIISCYSFYKFILSFKQELTK